MKELSSEAFLDAIRTGEYARWDHATFRSELLRPGRIDGVRPLVRHTDLPLVRRFVASSDPDEVLIAHMMGRILIRDIPQQIAPDFSTAYERWSGSGNMLLAISLFHDLAEQNEFLDAQRESFASMVDGHRREVKAVLFTFVGNEAGLFDVFSRRLKDVFSDNPQTLNNTGKAFMYVLYLGLIDEPSLRAKAVAELDTYRAHGDAFFQTLTEQTLSRLGQAT